MTKSIPLRLPLEDWPSVDISAWEAACSDTTLFSERRGLVSHAEGTRAIYRQSYGHWLSFLMRNRPDLLALDPFERLSKEAIQAFIDEQRGRSVQMRTIATHLQGLINVLFAFGYAPPTWLRRAQRRIYEESNPRALKKALPITARELYAWGLRLMAEAESRDVTVRDPIRCAVRFRQGLMVAIQIACPVRRRAMVAMRVDYHVLLQDSQVLLRFRKEDMKNGQAQEMPLPDALAAPMKCYIEHYRSLLLGETQSNALWVSERGAPSRTRATAAVFTS